MPEDSCEHLVSILTHRVFIHHPGSSRHCISNPHLTQPWKHEPAVRQRYTQGHISVHYTYKIQILSPVALTYWCIQHWQTFSTEAINKHSENWTTFRPSSLMCCRTELRGFATSGRTSRHLYSVCPGCPGDGLAKRTLTDLKWCVRRFQTAIGSFHHFFWVAVASFRRHQIQSQRCQGHISCINALLCHKSVCRFLFLKEEEIRLVSRHQRVTSKSTGELDVVFGFRLMYVLSGQIGMSQKPSGVAGTGRRESGSPHHRRKMHGQGRWGPRVNNLVRKLRHCKAVGRTQGAASLLSEL